MLADRENCIGCSACCDACVLQCIKMAENDKGFLEPIIDQTRCTGCGVCEKACPVICPPTVSQGNIFAQECFAAWNLDSAQRQSSTSGGVFLVLAHEVLKRGGVVVGAVFDEKFTLFHSMATTEEELIRQSGSKYAQSKLTGVLKKNTYLVENYILPEGYSEFWDDYKKLSGAVLFLKYKWKLMVVKRAKSLLKRLGLPV